MACSKSMHIGIHGAMQTASLKKVPYERVSLYQKSFAPPPSTLYALVKYRSSVNPSMDPRLFDTFFYTLPVRQSHSSDFQNMVLSFICPAQAKIYAGFLNEAMDFNRNAQEPLTQAVIESYRKDELIHNSLMVSMPILIVRNSFCNGQEEPIHEVTIIPPAAMPNYQI